jgi:hypothetical protein
VSLCGATVLTEKLALMLPAIMLTLMLPIFVTMLFVIVPTCVKIGITMYHASKIMRLKNHITIGAGLSHKTAFAINRSVAVRLVTECDFCHNIGKI